MASRTFTKTYTKTATKTETPKTKTELPPKAPDSEQCLRVLTWNVNGLDDDAGTPLRLRAIIEEIRGSNADVVALQEVVESFRSALVTTFSGIYSFEDEGASRSQHYYTLIMFRKDRLTKQSSKREGFTGLGSSDMGRDLLSVDFGFHAGTSRTFTVITSHLESGSAQYEPASCAKRKQQYEHLLRKVLSLASSSPNRLGIVTCGDFNLREAEDKEVRAKLKKAGVDCDLVVDAFVSAGSPAAARETWVRKINPSMATPMKARYDRQLYNGPSDAAARFSLMTGGMRLVGCRDVPGVDRLTSERSGFTTPSDHMGILCLYCFVGEGRAVADALATSSGTIRRRSDDDERALRADAAAKRLRLATGGGAAATIGGEEGVSPAARLGGGAVAEDDVVLVFVGSKNTTWSCQACTYVNVDAKREECEMCGTSK